MRLPNDIRWGVTAHIRPLLEALDEFERYGIVVAGESVTRLVLAHAGKIHQHARIGRKENEDEEPYLRRIIEAVQEFAETEEAGRLILAGAPHVFFRLHRLFPAPLRNRVVAMLGLSIDTTNQQLSEAIRTVRERAERTGEMKQVTDLLTLSAMGKKVAVGLQPTLDALNERRVWRLVYSDTFSPRGGRCEQCGRVYSSELKLCTHCNAALKPFDDLADAMVAQALDMEATVEQLRGLGAKRLNEAGGVGAFLRF
jgi:peptide subunit release factor 1 (eRF1)